mmetsp:Transcript_38873/g.37212  ORF Transcript_38873/g.37212 Transcript_38873/m.37212 type:complete len:274 (-) Transcript_38873:199-1020(-)
MPLVLGDIIHLTLFAAVVGLFGANGVDVVLGLEVEFPVEVGELVATAGVLHVGLLVDFVGVFIHHESLCRADAPDIIFFLFSANNEDLVLCLDAREVHGEGLLIPNGDSHRVLGVELVDVEVLATVIEVVKSEFGLRKDEIRFEADDIMEEASELVHFALHLNAGSGVLLEEGVVLADLGLQLAQLRVVGFEGPSLHEDLQVLVLALEPLELLDGFLHLAVELLQLHQRLSCEVLGRWLVVLDAFEIPDDVFRLVFLLIDDVLEDIVLLLHFF